jgi:MoxR-like ATPase
LQQNPIEQEGTYPLPEAQVEPFYAKNSNRIPKIDEERLVIRQNLKGNDKSKSCCFC